MIVCVCQSVSLNSLLFLTVTALLFKMEEANIASRAKAQEFIQATSQVMSGASSICSGEEHFSARS